MKPKHLTENQLAYLRSLVRMDLRKQQRRLPKMLVKFGETADISKANQKQAFIQEVLDTLTSVALEMAAGGDRTIPPADKVQYGTFPLGSVAISANIDDPDDPEGVT